MDPPLMMDVKYFRDLAAQCRELTKLALDPEVAAELAEIADELTARADEMAREPQRAAKA